MSEKEDIAREISERCLVLFSANFPYFSRALSSLEIEIDENTDSVYTDGKKIGINPEYLLSFVAEVGNSGLIFIHLLLHCLFLHPFEEKKDENYDLACDMTVAYVTDELKLYSATDKKYNARK